ncbi:MAG: IS110 family transposase [Candidatus Rokuibacteriota bacterium]|nr:MAG: IS110 family transposase [Candidatus Rokubacteria bacterium]PYN70685.1 MAG: IS110 family transposase [Candidatus Rokubacteria bacterium]
MILGNAHHIQNVPGRKTDVKDSEWLAELARHGLSAKSFVPPKPLRRLRELLRYRRKLMESRTAERNRLLKLLETANIKLASVMTDVFGVSGRLMLHALIEGISTPMTVAALAKGRLRKKVVDLAQALDGRLDDHHRFLLQLQLRRLDQADTDLATLDKHIDEALAPYQEQCQALQQIPGVSRVVSAVIIAELGTDMTVFRSAQHAAAWAGVCPGNNESAGKRRQAGVRKGNVHLRTALVEAAVAASHTKGSYLRDKFYRLRARRGTKRAAMAIGHKILIAAYQMLATRAPYKDLGATYLDGLEKRRTTQHLVRRLQRLGYEVTLGPKVA